MGFSEDLDKIFNKKKRQLDKLVLFLNISTQSGDFYRFRQSKRSALLTRYNRLKRQLSGMGWPLKAAALGTSFVLGNTDEATAQSAVGPFFEQKRANNPLRYPIKGARLAPTVVDLDNDGDYDIAIGEHYGYIKILLNEGSPTDPRFTDYRLLDETLNPIFGAGMPAFADLDGDNDLDLIFGTDGSLSDRIRYFANNGGTVGDPINPLTFTEQFGSWNPLTKQGNPFYGIDPGYGARPFFVDFDMDGDQDILIGHRFSSLGDDNQLHYYVNDGNSNFALAPFPDGPPNELAITGFNNYNAAPHLADIDLDGQLDLVLGNRSGELRFFKGSTTTFTEQTGAWNPVAKTGNPFDNIFADRYTVPALADLDGDGDLDMVLGNQRKYGYGYGGGFSYNDPLRYFINDPAAGETAVFKELTGLSNPFDGVDVGRNAAPAFVQLDAGAEMDAVLGSKYEFNRFSDYGDRIRFFKNTSGSFEEKTGSDNPFASILPLLNSSLPYTPHFVNLDADADLELVVKEYFYDLRVFDKSGDTWVELTGAANPFASINSLIYSNQASLAFGDIDNDGDVDLFLGVDTGYGGRIQFFENTGSASAPVFEEKTGAENPLDLVQHPFYMPLPVLVDIDNDGDLDAIVPRAGIEEGGVEIFFFENTGTPSAPVFTQLLNHPFENLPISYYAQLAFIDWDKDGDLDFFSGGLDGTVKFFLNGNPTPLTSFSLSQTTFNFGAGSITLDANLTLTDSDSDLVLEARIAIQNFQPGEEVLTFTPQGGITGLFDTATGVLTLNGQATTAVYQTVLRSVRYEFIGAKPATGGKSGNSSGKTVVVNKSVTFEIFDSDLTAPALATIALQLNFANEVPAITGSTASIMFTGTPIVLNSTVTVTDADDADLEGATVRITPASFVSGQDILAFTNQNGISGSFNTSNGTLTLAGISSIANYQAALRSVQYQNSNAAPNSQIRIVEFTVTDGENNSNTEITQVLLNVNQPPAIIPTTLITVINGQVMLDLSTIISDPDGNLDSNSFNIVQSPTSGASATIVNGVLTIDYSNSTFAGTDTMIIEAFDLLGERSQAVITINVAGEVVVRNGISANGDNLNPIFRLENIAILAPDNQVTIFNRWGDKVFEIDRYDNLTRRFDGTSDDGDDLPSGIYFYKIRLNNGQSDLEGYLTLKR